MKKRTKFVMVAMALCLTVALGVLGIFAVKTLNMTVGGNITFSADGISFVVSDGVFKTTSNATYTGIMTETTKLKGFEMNTNTTQASVQDKIDSWTNLNLTMSSLGDAVLHFSVTNKMSTVPLYVVMNVTLGSNLNNNMDIVVSPNKVAIPAGGTASQDYTVTFDLLDDTINASLTGFKIDIEITPTEPPAQGTQTSTGLKHTEDTSSLLVEGLTMQFGSKFCIRGGEPAVRSLCEISSQLKAEVEADGKKSFKWFAMPLAYLDRVNPNNYTYIDWVKALDDYGETSYVLDPITSSNIISVGDHYEAAMYMNGFPYGAVNLGLLMIAVVETIDDGGKATYQYPSFPEGEDYRTFANSLGQAACLALNENAMGTRTLTAEELAGAISIVDQFVDKTNNLSSPVYDNSVFDFSINLGIPSAFIVGKTVDMQVQVSPNTAVPISYVSSNTAVATVDKRGKLTTVGAGNAIISVYVCGQVKTVTINVA